MQDKKLMLNTNVDVWLLSWIIWSYIFMNICLCNKHGQYALNDIQQLLSFNLPLVNVEIPIISEKEGGMIWLMLFYKTSAFFDDNIFY